MTESEYYTISEFLIKQSVGLYEEYGSINDEQEKTKIFVKIKTINDLKLKAAEEFYQVPFEELEQRII